MSAPTQCPVCASAQIEHVLKKAALSLSLGNGLDRVSGVLAYRCPNGHIFLTVPEGGEAHDPLGHTA